MTSAHEKKSTILVIDDDTLVRRMLCSALHKMHYKTVEAPTGSSGLQAFKKNNPDLVITDLIMPDENGFEAILKIRAVNPNVKIIAMSSGGAYKKNGFLEMAEDLGAQATIKKPFTVAEIETAVSALLGK